VHARKLEDAGYVACRKSFEGRVPRTDYRLTAAAAAAPRALPSPHGSAHPRHARALSPAGPRACASRPGAVLCKELRNTRSAALPIRCARRRRRPRRVQRPSGGGRGHVAISMDGKRPGPPRADARSAATAGRAPSLAPSTGAQPSHPQPHALRLLRDKLAAPADEVRASCASSAASSAAESGALRRARRAPAECRRRAPRHRSIPALLGAAIDRRAMRRPECVRACACAHRRRD
jgi:hypothetical protein